MLAGGGAAYQGIFRNPLADPYLLGVAAGAGLGATIVVVSGGSLALTPPAAFAGAVLAVALTYLLGAGAGRGGESAATRSGTGSILLAGIAVAAMLTAFQTYLQQEHTQTLATVYSWILGGLSAATWSDVWLILPYVAVSAIALLLHRRFLDVLRVGETEATSLGVNVARLRLLVVMAATLGRRGGGRGQRADRLRGHHRAARGPAHRRAELPGLAAGVDDRRGRVPRARRRRRADRAGAVRSPDRRDHGGDGRPVLLVRAQVAARAAGSLVIGFTGLTVRYGEHHRAARHFWQDRRRRVARASSARTGRARRRSSAPSPGCCRTQARSPSANGPRTG